jgi:hypothetical protein
MTRPVAAASINVAPVAMQDDTHAAEHYRHRVFPLLERQKLSARFQNDLAAILARATGAAHG